LGRQDSCFQFLVLPALEVPNVDDERCHGPDNTHGQDVLFWSLTLQSSKRALDHSEPHLRLLHGNVREMAVTGRYGVGLWRHQSIHRDHVENRRIRVEALLLSPSAIIKKSLLNTKHRKHTGQGYFMIYFKNYWSPEKDQSDNETG
jgi:hypothetical protein